MMKAQTKWRWEHAIYFFLGGLGAGAYVTGVIADFAGGDWAGVSKIGVFLGFPCVLVGALILMVDLGTPLNAIHAWKRPGTSWIARGVIILTIFLILGAIHIGFWIWPFTVLEGSPGARQFIGVLGLISGFGLMLYTGFLLGANRPVASWSNPMLPLLFLVNALFSGVLAVMLVGSLITTTPIGPLRALESVAIILILVQAFALVFYIQGSHRVEESRASVKLLLSGEVSSLFWYGVVCLGLLLPLILELVSIAGPLDGGGALRIFAALAGLIGSVLLRQVILASGVLAPLRAGRFEFALPHI